MIECGYCGHIHFLQELVDVDIRERLVAAVKNQVITENVEATGNCRKCGSKVQIK